MHIHTELVFIVKTAPYMTMPIRLGFVEHNLPVVDLYMFQENAWLLQSQLINTYRSLITLINCDNVQKLLDLH